MGDRWGADCGAPTDDFRGANDASVVVDEEEEEVGCCWRGRGSDEGGTR